ncbi:MAG: hypothetical protein AB7N54_02640, partial [Alphaproteobacteria bacterium]
APATKTRPARSCDPAGLFVFVSGMCGGRFAPVQFATVVQPAVRYGSRGALGGQPGQQET